MLAFFFLFPFFFLKLLLLSRLLILGPWTIFLTPEILLPLIGSGYPQLENPVR